MKRTISLILVCTLLFGCALLDRETKNSAGRETMNPVWEAHGAQIVKVEGRQFFGVPSREGMEVVVKNLGTGVERQFSHPFRIDQGIPIPGVEGKVQHLYCDSEGNPLWINLHSIGNLLKNGGRQLEQFGLNRDRLLRFKKQFGQTQGTHWIEMSPQQTIISEFSDVGNIRVDGTTSKPCRCAVCSDPGGWVAKVVNCPLLRAQVESGEITLQSLQWMGENARNHFLQVLRQCEIPLALLRKL